VLLADVVTSPVQLGTWLGLLLLLAALAWLVLAAARGAELFRIRVSGGRATLERGRLPRALFDEISDVVQRQQLQRGLIRVVVQAGAPRLLLQADSSSSEQALRNVLGRFSLSQIRTGGMRAH
jgi:hypothetical protein